MSFPTKILEALEVYDHNKGFWRRLFRRDQAAIRAMRRLNGIYQTNPLKIYQCFVENMPKTTQESYKVYAALLTYLDQIDLGSIPGTMDELTNAGLLKPQNIDKLTHLIDNIPLNENYFQTLATLINRLSINKLLTQANFDNIAKHFETSEENIRALDSIASAVNLLKGHLNQENLNSLLEKPMQARNVAAALKILDANHLLTPSNRYELHNDNNQFLLSDEAYSLVWNPLEIYLHRLASKGEKQLIFDQLTKLAQQENPAERAENYMHELNKKFNMPRSRANSENKPYRSRANSENKFFTAPAQNQKKRASLENLVDSPPKPGTL